MNEKRRKPDWLKIRLPGGAKAARIENWHRRQGLHSVCASAACPNRGECWSQGTATFMILGNLCTRDCAFCNISHGRPISPDPAEAAKVAAAVAELGLQYAVVTSVTRDDLDDGGAAAFVALVKEIRQAAPACRVELLIPDLGGNWNALEAILAAGPDLLGHNLETVPRLYPLVRSGADYRRSLELLARCRNLRPDIPVKSGLMAGLGETRQELTETMAELTANGCRLLTVGQYLQPTRNHWPVHRYLTPDEFQEIQGAGLKIGFAHVEAGPLVRSSYHAEEQYKEAINAKQG
ncbi:MAG: lipoyl synthase [Deltaproteobacteria bacterium]|nr:lipoyl synthase [Deltaproteobacteria bacterium]